ncbi:MAG: ABC transporter permease [Candidatus Hodarchaeales archaeon]
MADEILEAIFKAFELILTLDPEVLQITFLSLRISMTSVLIATVIGIPLGIFVGSKEFNGKRIFLIVINTGMAFPPVVMGLFIFVLFSRLGPFAQLDILLTDTAMILAQLLLALPIIIGLTSSAVENLDTRILEAATTLGANQWQIIVLIFHETRLALIAAVINAFGGAISEIGAVQIVGGNIRFKTRTLTTAIGREISAGRWEFAMALGIILLVTAFAVNVILTYIQHNNRFLLRAD